MTSKQSNNIRVMCRFRPMNELEQSKNGTIIYKLLKKNGTLIQHPDKIHHPQPMSFYFDKIFDSKCAQVEVFEEAAIPLIDNIFEGYNATIFAYGQTGSGKTHTMMGDMIKSEMHPRHGIIPRVVREIWNRIVLASSHYEFELKISFLEIYNEQIYDLLSTDTYHNNHGRKKYKKHKREKLIIREYSDQVFVENLNEIYVRDQNELFDLVKSANKHRISAQTKMNSNSSRSHAVLTIILGQEDKRTGNSKKSKFCLVDLAGSEKVGKTQARGQRLKEATSINKSLTTLGTCMNKLADNMSDNKGPTRHIPFRESVLTRLLSDSLGGNCKTSLIINTSPCSYNVEETISTLRFGERAKKIKTKARINQIKTPQQYRKELQIAQSEIMKLYRIIEECALDITNAFKGTLHVDNCKSYKALLDLKKYTLNIVNGSHKASVNNKSLLANILPDLSNLQALKKVNAVKKLQKKAVLAANNNTMTPALMRQLSNSISNAGTSPSNKANNQQFDPRNRLRRSRTGSFEDLNVDEPVTLVRDKKPKIDPLKRKKKQDFRVSTNAANNAFKPPDFHPHIFNVSSANCLPGLKADDGLSLGQLGQFAYNSNVEESEFSDYNSEFDALGIMSPAADGTQSDASNMSPAANYFTFAHEVGNLSMDYTDFQEEELPKHFFEMTEEQRLEFAKKKRIDPLLIEYRYQISREIDWVDWNSDDEEDENPDEIKKKRRDELERAIDFNKQRLLMLCRLIRTKTQEYSSRSDIEMSKYQSLSSQYRAKNEENSKLMQQNTYFEKLYEKTENDKRELSKNLKKLKRELAEKKKQLNTLQKQLTIRMNELNIERRNQINLSNDKTSMLRKKVHEKYGNKYMKKIQTEIIKNNNKDIDLRFNELTQAFTEQSNKYQDLEQMIEKSKKQIEKYEQLMRQKDNEENTLREEIENEDLIRKELIFQHNLELKKIQDSMKKSINKADMWKRRAFVYKNAVNSLMEEAEFNNLNDESDEEENKDVDSDNPPEFKPHSRPRKVHLDVDTMANTKLKPLDSFSPRSMARSLAEEEGRELPKSPSWVKHRKARQTISGVEEAKMKQKAVINRTRDKHSYTKSNYNRMRDDALYMSPSQKAALTSVKMKIRGGGGNGRNIHRTPVRTTDTRNIYNKGSFNHKNSMNSVQKVRRIHRRQVSQPLKGSLPPPSNRYTGYSSDEYQHPYGNDKSRSPVPVVGIDNLVRNKSIDIDSLDQSPSFAFLGAYSPRGPYKKGASPLPPPVPPPRSHGGIKHSRSGFADEEGSDDEEFNDNHMRNSFLSPKSDQFTSPAGSFFSKIKQVNNNDDYKAPTPIIRRTRRKAVSMPEPSGNTDEDEFDCGYSDTSNFTDDNIPSYRNRMESIDTLYPSTTKRGNKKKGRRSVAEAAMD